MSLKVGRVLSILGLVIVVWWVIFSVAINVPQQLQCQTQVQKMCFDSYGTINLIDLTPVIIGGLIASTGYTVAKKNLANKVTFVVAFTAILTIISWVVIVYANIVVHGID